MKTWLESAEDCFNTKENIFACGVTTFEQFLFMMNNNHTSEIPTCDSNVSKSVWFLLILAAMHKEI